MMLYKRCLEHSFLWKLLKRCSKSNTVPPPWCGVGRSFTTYGGSYAPDIYIYVTSLPSSQTSYGSVRWHQIWCTLSRAPCEACQKGRGTWTVCNVYRPQGPVHYCCHPSPATVASTPTATCSPLLVVRTLQSEERTMTILHSHSLLVHSTEKI